MGNANERCYLVTRGSGCLGALEGGRARARSFPGQAPTFAFPGELTGVPVVLNASFNLKGEPIVNTPAEALSTFRRSQMDVLVLDRFVIEKDLRN
ncbi:MAG: hypothetical protein HYY46_07115 [Deltaproteobacteria bacterium]|nr:hypothetical protein [Deltaproteobacteria bacterium]